MDPKPIEEDLKKNWRSYAKTIAFVLGMAAGGAGGYGLTPSAPPTTSCQCSARGECNCHKGQPCAPDCKCDAKGCRCHSQPKAK